MKNFILLLILFSVGLQWSCTNEIDSTSKKLTKMDLMSTDHHSFARPKEASITHLNLNVKVSFEDRSLACEAKYTIQALPSAKEIIFDTKKIKINRITINDTIEVINYRFGTRDPLLGSPLVIPINDAVKTISIKYETSTDAAALQWLSAQQTADNNPFLFTQSQAILCRTWIPIQDSPSIKFTYNAKVEVPTGFLALMSASNPQEVNDSGIYKFEMKQPIPAYLMALAVGKLAFHSYDSITGVYAEPSTFDAARTELDELHLMVAAAEKLYGKYQWERFDVLMLPPSFPFGGMENPNLTFATPTILCGDKSLTSLIAHELAHSWSGNLVTNATWEDFWLNEGFTVYFEYRIMEEVYGKPYADMLALISERELKMEVAEMMELRNEKDTQLKLDLENRDPDEGLTSIAYDKGYFFLKRLEEIAGRNVFDKFLRKYFETFAFQTMNTKSFIIYAKQYLFASNNITYPRNLFEDWIYGQGLPADMPKITSELFNKVEITLSEWMETKDVSLLPDSAWSTQEWLHFMHELPDSITANDLKIIDSKKRFTQSNNSEIQMEWYLLSLKHGYTKVIPFLESFLVKTGRRKFLMPLYISLIEHFPDLAISIYKKARPNYHFVSFNSLDKLFETKY